MTAVIAFPKIQLETKTRKKQLGPGQVIIFTGVHHERLIDTPLNVVRSAARKSRLPSLQNQATAEELD
jgi:hypothetical protein